MRVSTIVAIVITVVLTVIIMQNTDEVKFRILFADVYLPKLVMMTAVAVAAFIVGVMAGRPRKTRRVEMHEDADFDEDDRDRRYPRRPNTLSDEDRDYIS